MCLFTVIDTGLAGRWLGLRDAYGKYHLARITAGAMVAAGDELHGAHPALGRHFLVAAVSGHRLSASFEFVRVSRQEMVDHLHPAHAHRLPSSTDAMTHRPRRSSSNESGAEQAA